MCLSESYLRNFQDFKQTDCNSGLRIPSQFEKFPLWTILLIFFARSLVISGRLQALNSGSELLSAWEL